MSWWRLRLRGVESARRKRRALLVVHSGLIALIGGRLTLGLGRWDLLLGSLLGAAQVPSRLLVLRIMSIFTMAATPLRVLIVLMLYALRGLAEMTLVL